MIQVTKIMTLALRAIDLIGKTFLILAIASVSYADQVYDQTVIVTKSACVGTSCLNNETFGATVLKLKEDNVRFEFLDNSSEPGFPAVDWKMIANDEEPGGKSYFALQDQTANTYPLRIEAGAPTSSLHISSNLKSGFSHAARVGIGTATPSAEIDVHGHDSPGVRLTQTQTGFASHTWDIAGNEVNLFVRDVTNASVIPFKIAPGAPNNSLTVSPDGYIGIGVNPFSRIAGEGSQAPLHIQRSDGKTQAIIEDTASIREKRFVMTLRNNGQSQLSLVDSGGTADSWDIAAGRANSGATPSKFLIAYNGDATAAGRLAIDSNGHIELGKGVTIQPNGMISASYQGTPPPSVASTLAKFTNNGPSLIEFYDEVNSKTYHVGAGKLGADHAVGMRVDGVPAAQMFLDENGKVVVGGNFTYTSNGDLGISGTLTQNSSRDSKEQIASVDQQTILDKVLDLQIVEWQYINDKNEARHVGPMAGQFYSSFGLGGEC